VAIREASVGDADEIASLIVELAEYERLSHEVVWTTEELRRSLFEEGSPVRVLLVEDDGEVAGFALYFLTFSTFLGRSGIWLEDLFVREPFRGRGFGKALLEHLRKMTSGRVEWNVLDWNEPSIAFYRSLGAKPVVGWTTYRWLPDAL
jgi:GNAT superfamily N-acetyltransferase